MNVTVTLAIIGITCLVSILGFTGVVHGGWGHLLFNMLTLYFFGPVVEQYFGISAESGWRIVPGYPLAPLPVAPGICLFNRLASLDPSQSQGFGHLPLTAPRVAWVSETSLGQDSSFSFSDNHVY